MAGAERHHLGHVHLVEGGEEGCGLLGLHEVGGDAATQRRHGFDGLAGGRFLRLFLLRLGLRLGLALAPTAAALAARLRPRVNRLLHVLLEDPPAGAGGGDLGEVQPALVEEPAGGGHDDGVGAGLHLGLAAAALGPVLVVAGGLVGGLRRAGLAAAGGLRPLPAVRGGALRGALGGRRLRDRGRVAAAGARPARVAQLADLVADGGLVALGLQDLAQRARLGGGQLDGDLVGLDLHERLVLGDGLALLLEPAADLDLGDGFADFGDNEVNGHEKQGSWMTGGQASALLPRVRLREDQRLFRERLRGGRQGGLRPPAPPERASSLQRGGGLPDPACTFKPTAAHRVRRLPNPTRRNPCTATTSPTSPTSSSCPASPPPAPPRAP